MNKKHITICGSFGFGNAGDEAVPLALADLAQSLQLDCQFDVLGRFDEPAMPEIIGLGKQDEERRRQIQGQPMLLIGGGMVEDKDHATLFRCAPYFGKDFTPRASLFAAAVESGVRYNWWKRWKINKILRNMKHLFVRDEVSFQALRKIAPRRKIEIIGDSVLWMNPDETDISTYIGDHTRYIAVTLASRWNQEPEWLPWITTQLAKTAQQLQAAIVFVPMTKAFDNDRVEHRRVLTELQASAPGVPVISIEEMLEPRTISTLFRHSILTISMRLHGCVMAYARKTPFIALAYHPKLLGFAKTVGWERFVVPSTLPSQQNAGAYGYLFSDFAKTDVQLPHLVQEALQFGDFSKLNHLKQTLAQAFKECVEI